MISRFLGSLTAAAIFVSGAQSAFACDLCSVYSSLEQRIPKTGTLQLGISQQFTEFGRLQRNGSYVSNALHERVASSQTHLTGSYDFSDTLSADVILPYLNRRFTRATDAGIERGTEAGIGDMVLRVNYLPYRSLTESSVKIIKVFAGLKLPTGDSDRLAAHDDGHSEQESMDEHDEHGAEEMLDEHAEHEHLHALRHNGVTHVESAIHGHDLALGSGSFDFPIGIGGFWSEGRALLEGRLEYTIRTEGDHSYRHANDLQWSIAPGYYLLLKEDQTLSLRLSLSGEYKGKDEGPGGVKDGSTSMNAVFWGPQLFLTKTGSYAGFLGYEMPVNIENSGYQAVASYRIRGGFSWRF